MKFTDIVDLAKSGWSLKDVKEALELAETSPAVQETDPAELKHNGEEAAAQPAAPVTPVVQEPKQQQVTEENGSALDKLFD